MMSQAAVHFNTN